MNVLSKLSGYRTYLVAAGLVGLALYQVSTGLYEQGLATLMQAGTAAGLRAAIANSK